MTHKHAAARVAADRLGGDECGCFMFAHGEVIMPGRNEPLCPRCGQTISRNLKDHGDLQCSRCDVTFRVLLDEPSGSTVLVEPRPRITLPEPLFLPRGSVRALVALTVCGAAWLLIFAGRDLPSYLFNLLLTVVVYYVSLGGRETGDRMHDPYAHLERPGTAAPVRGMLMFGFIAAGLFLAATNPDRFMGPQYLEFFMILLGLFAGRGYNSAIRGATMITRGLARHAKAVGVLLAAGALSTLLLTGQGGALPPVTMIGLCAIISFYFGSR